jgi:polysaccharide deacetylase 2 family uncharacterized protein YibQ
VKHDSELNKPLRPVDGQQKGSSSAALFSSLGLVILCALPVVHFYGGFDFLTAKKPLEKVASVQSESDQPEDILSNETTATVPSRNHTLDPDGGQFQEVSPQGTLERVVPKPLIKQLPKAPSIKRQELAMVHLPDPQLVERGASGVIPKISSDGVRPMDMYSREPDTEGNFGVARVVIVIGGMGISQTSTQEAIQKLPPNVTLAFAPYGNSLPRWMQTARRAGHELLLQVPMEPIDFPQSNPGPHTLKASADLEENLANLHWTMSRITNYVGVTNYLGQKMLQQPASLSPIFAEVSKRGLLFFEDGSVKNSMGPGVAVKELVPYAKGDLLIDNVRSRSAIANKLNQLAEQAKRTGLAIGTGNAFPDTIAMVAEFANRAKRSGIEITPVSAIVKDPNR